MARQEFNITTRSASPIGQLFSWQANVFVLNLTVDIPGLEDLGDADRIVCEIIPAINSGRDALAASDATIAGSTLTFEFSGAQMNQAIPEKESSVMLALVVSAVYGEGGDDERLETLYQATHELRAHSASLATPGPPKPYLTITRAQADALYLSKADAESDYLTQEDAASTYQTPAQSANLYSLASNARLKEVVSSDGYELTSITRDSDGVVTTATVLWPDGAAGTFTTVTKNTTFLAVDAFTISYLGTPSRLVTQELLTRNADGAVTVKPALTITIIP